jgi:hypothetical protein
VNLASISSGSDPVNENVKHSLIDEQSYRADHIYQQHLSSPLKAHSTTEDMADTELVRREEAGSGIGARPVLCFPGANLAHRRVGRCQFGIVVAH